MGLFLETVKDVTDRRFFVGGRHGAVFLRLPIQRFYIYLFGYFGTAAKVAGMLVLTKVIVAG